MFISCSSQNLSYLAFLLPLTAPTETGDIVLLALGAGDDKIAWSFTRYLFFSVMQKEDRNSCCFNTVLQILSRNVKTVTLFFLVARNFSFVFSISESTVFWNWYSLMATCIFVRCRMKYFYLHYMFCSWDTSWVACLSTVFQFNHQFGNINETCWVTAELCFTQKS